MKWETTSWSQIKRRFFQALLYLWKQNLTIWFKAVEGSSLLFSLLLEITVLSDLVLTFLHSSSESSPFSALCRFKNSSAAVRALFCLSRSPHVRSFMIESVMIGIFRLIWNWLYKQSGKRVAYWLEYSFWSVLFCWYIF